MSLLHLAPAIFSAILTFPPHDGEIRLLVPGLEKERTAQGRVLEAAGVHEVPSSEGELDPAKLSMVEAVLLDERSLKAAGGWSEKSVSALVEAVRAGKGLVVAGQAALAFPHSSEFSRLLGRKAPLPPPLPPRDGHGLLVAFLDQSHAVTQCITHLFFPDCSPRLEAEHVVVLATSSGVGPGRSTLPGVSSALWTRQEGGGRILVLALTACQADSTSGPILSALIARAVQWVAGKPITIRLPERLPLAAPLLEPGGAALVEMPKGFYRGRQIAPVMGFEGASWLERADRENTEHPEKVLDSLDIAEGSTVADLGAGTGYFTFRLARRVGPRGRVLAVEIQKEMLALLEERIEKESPRNIEPILATPLDPRLPSGSVDLALLVDVYHEFAHPAQVLSALRESLVPGNEGRRPGRLVLVEYRGEDPTVPIKPLHRTTVEQVRAEIEPMGFRWIETKGFLPHQHILIFEK